VSPAELLDSDSTWLIRSHKAAIVSELQNDAPRWAWLVVFEDRSIEVYCHPDASHAEILKRYPDALAAEPIPERVAPIYEVAWPDAETVSTMVTGKVSAKVSDFHDDRRTCTQCVNLAGLRCLAAWRGEIVANRDCEPLRDIPRRCEGYAPGADDPDTRHGRERWQELIQKGSE
jgi:hypothetical protein